MYEAKYASREDIDAAMRLGCGRPMGPLALLDLIGVDTAYGPGGDVRQAATGCTRPRRSSSSFTAGLLGRKSGRGFYTYDGPAAVVVADALDAAAAPAPAAAPGRERSAWPAPAPWPPDRRGLRQGRVRRGARRPQPGEGRRRAGRIAGQSLDKVQGGWPTEDDRRRRWPGSPPPPSLDAFADVDLVVEAVAEDLASSRSFREPGQGLQAGRGAGHHHLLAAGGRARAGHRAPPGRRRDALLQPGAGDEAGRGRPHGADRRRRHRDRPGAVRQVGKHAVRAATGPGSS